MKNQHATHFGFSIERSVIRRRKGYGSGGHEEKKPIRNQVKYLNPLPLRTNPLSLSTPQQSTHGKVQGETPQPTRLEVKFRYPKTPQCIPYEPPSWNPMGPLGGRKRFLKVLILDLVPMRDHSLFGV
jgi:hypothetical protein